MSITSALDARREPVRAKHYTRIVATADGGSAFQDAEFALAERAVAADVDPMSVAGLAVDGGVLFLSSAGFGDAPHPAPRTQWVVMLRGAIEVEVTDGTRRLFGPGDLVLAADTTGRGHRTRTAGDPPLEGLFIPVSDPAAPTG